jgi:hypothetical protein
MRAILFGIASVLAGCSTEEQLAIAAGSGRFTPAEIHSAGVSMNTAEALKKASSPEEKAAIMAKYYCDVAWEHRRGAWLGDLKNQKPAEHADYMRSEPSTREKYWQGVSSKLGCKF